LLEAAAALVPNPDERGQSPVTNAARMRALVVSLVGGGNMADIELFHLSVDPATTLAFPLNLAPKSLSFSLALVGLGVRTVSFLRVKVYSAGFYVPEGKDGRWGTDRMGEEGAMASFLKDGAPCAMRIGTLP
jgi:hypothetical protein